MTANDMVRNVYKGEDLDLCEEFVDGYLKAQTADKLSSHLDEIARYEAIVEAQKKCREDDEEVKTDAEIEEEDDEEGKEVCAEDDEEEKAPEVAEDDEEEKAPEAPVKEKKGKKVREEDDEEKAPEVAEDDEEEVEEDDEEEVEEDDEEKSEDEIVKEAWVNAFGGYNSDRFI